MKRGCSSSSDTLTGGTGDVNPQILSFMDEHALANSAGSQSMVRTFPNPMWDLNRSISLQSCGAKAKAYVMEVLKVGLISDIPNLSSVTASAITVIVNSSLSYDNAPAPDLPTGSGYVQTYEWLLDLVRGVPQNNTNVIASGGSATFAATNPTGAPSSGAGLWEWTDLTDDAGHGVLIGAPVFNLRHFVRYSATPGYTGSTIAGVQIHYRVKAIAYDEWVRQFAFGI